MDDKDLLVMKFGGTSVGTPQAMGQALQICRDARREWRRLVVVTSALAGVTDLLVKSAERAARGDLSAFSAAHTEIAARHHALVEALITPADARPPIHRQIDALLADFTNLCQAIHILGEASPRALDAVASLGERLSVRVLAAALESAGLPARPVDSTECVLTDDTFQNAVPDMAATGLRANALLAPILAAGQTPVVTGFLGATPEGLTTTLGRGGSDYSASILAVALRAQEVWIWTDVDGVMTADPRLVPDARTIAELSYREVSELAYFGAKVLHPKTIRPVIEAGIGLRVCNTFNPQNPGTRLVAELPAAATGVIKAVTAIRGLQLITIEGRGMLGVPGVAARTFGAVANTGTSVPLISQASSEQSICFAVPIESTRSVISALQNTFAREIASRDIDRVWATDEVVIITVVGAGMRSTPGIAGRVFQALGETNINVIAIAQGSSEVSISMLIDAADTRTAVQALHSLIV